MSTIATGVPGNRPCAMLPTWMTPSGCGCGPANDAVVYQARRARRHREGTRSSAWPRPERLGLVRKYLWALNGSSPSAGTIRTLEPSGRTRKLCSLSSRLASMIWLRTCSCTVGLSSGTRASTRRSRLRCIRSAEEMNTRAFAVRQAVAAAEGVDAGMLEKAADDRLDADVLRQARHARPQAADAAHHEVDLHAGAGSPT